MTHNNKLHTTNGTYTQYVDLIQLQYNTLFQKQSLYAFPQKKPTQKQLSEPFCYVL